MIEIETQFLYTGVFISEYVCNHRYDVHTIYFLQRNKLYEQLHKFNEPSVETWKQAVVFYIRFLILLANK